MIQQLMVFFDVRILQLNLRAGISATLAQINRFKRHSGSRIANAVVSELGIIFVVNQSFEQISAICWPCCSLANFVFNRLYSVLKSFCNGCYFSVLLSINSQL